MKSPEHIRYIREVRKYLERAERASNEEHGGDMLVKFRLTGNAIYVHKTDVTWLEFTAYFPKAPEGENNQMGHQWCSYHPSQLLRVGDPLEYIYEMDVMLAQLD